MNPDFAQLMQQYATIFILLAVWSMIWKAFALWFSARGDQKAWFIVLTIFNTLGLLEIIYLAFCRKKKI